MRIISQSSSQEIAKRPRTRAADWVPRRVYYVLALLRRLLPAGKPQALSNFTIKTKLGFGSEGEVSQIMRWLAGEAPTTGRWAWGVLTTPQRYRFIERERMPSGGYLITLLARPKLIEESAPTAVQLSFLDDPLMIPLPANQDAPARGSFAPMQPARADRRHSNAPDHQLQRDHAKESLEEVNKQQHGAQPQKNEWAGITIEGAHYLPIDALKRAGHTPASVAAADAKIRTRTDLDTSSQARILIAGLLNNQPILSAAEFAQQQESRYERSARSVQSHYAPRSARRSAACAPEPNAERDAEFGAQLAEFERLAAARRMPAL